MAEVCRGQRQTSQGDFPVIMWGCTAPQLLSAVRVGWEVQGYRSTPLDDGSLRLPLQEAANPRGREGGQETRKAPHAHFFPPLDAVSGSKGCLSPLARSGLQGMPKTKGGLESKQRKGRKISWRQDREHKL